MPQHLCAYRSLALVSSGASGPSLANPSRKRLNIPVGTSAEQPQPPISHGSEAFVLPLALLRHQRKLGEEADGQLDYVLEDEDEAWLKGNARIRSDREAAQALTPELLELLLNLLEKISMGDNPVSLVRVQMQCAHAVYVDARMLILLSMCVCSPMRRGYCRDGLV